jgi:predicted dehydrogenase
MYRYNPAVKYAMELAKSGKLGDIYAVEAHMDCLHPKKKREWLGQYKGGMMFFLGCHLVDLIIQFKGFPDKVIPMNCATGIDGVDSEDYGFALFQYKDGVSFAKTCAAEVNGFERRQLVICGSKGTVEIKPLEKYPVQHPNRAMNSYIHVTYIEDAVSWNDCGKDITFESFDRYDAMMQDFAKQVRGEKEANYSYDYELELFRHVLKASGYLA